MPLLSRVSVAILLAMLTACSLFVDIPEMSGKSVASSDASLLDGAVPADGEPSPEPFTPGDMTILASGQGGPRGITLSATHVFWTNSSTGTIVCVPKAAGPVQQLESGQLTPLDITFAGGDLYWFNSTGRRSTVLRKLAISSDASTPMADIDGVSFSRMGTDANNLWLTESRDLYRIPKVGGPFERLATASAPLTAVASDGSTASVASSNGILRPNGDGGLDTFATGSTPLDIATDGVAIFWIATNGTLYALPAAAAGVTPTALATGLAGGTRLALFGEDVYVTATGAGTTTGRIVRVPKAGGSSTVLAAELAEPFAIAVDASGVYWTGHGDGTIRKLAFE